MDDETAKRIAGALERIAGALELQQKQETAKWREEIRKDQAAIARRLNEEERRWYFQRT